MESSGQRCRAARRLAIQHLEGLGSDAGDTPEEFKERMSKVARLREQLASSRQQTTRKALLMLVSEVVLAGDGMSLTLHEDFGGHTLQTGSAKIRPGLARKSGW